MKTMSHASYTCFKAICDSHNVNKFIAYYPNGKIIWVFRNYLDSANSAIRRFPGSDRAVRLICESKPGAGWFEEALSSTTLKTLRAAYNKSLSKFEVSCLTWWALNSIILESGITNTSLVQYEMSLNAIRVSNVK